MQKMKDNFNVTLRSVQLWPAFTLDFHLLNRYTKSADRDGPLPQPEDGATTALYDDDPLSGLVSPVRASAKTGEALEGFA